jgi:hypothetical protein
MRWKSRRNRKVGSERLLYLISGTGWNSHFANWHFRARKKNHSIVTKYWSSETFSSTLGGDWRERFYYVKMLHNFFHRGSNDFFFVVTIRSNNSENFSFFCSLRRSFEIQLAPRLSIGYIILDPRDAPNINLMRFYFERQHAPSWEIFIECVRLYIQHYDDVSNSKWHNN